MKLPAKRAASAVLGLMMAAQLTAIPTSAAAAEGFENGSALNMTQIARYTSGQFNVDGGVMEIIAYNTKTEWAYAINGQSGKLAAIPLSGLTANGSVAQLSGTEIDVKALVEAQDTSFRYGDMTSVAVSPDNSMLAAALQAEGYNDAGRVALFSCNQDGTLTLQGLVETGVQPDMVTFADDNTVLTADEGEPREGYGDSVADPKGSVTIVDVDSLTSSVVGFDAFDSERESLAAEGVVLRKNTAPSVDLEPEYIAVDSGKAYVTLQEANAIAVLDIEAGAYDGVYSIGFEDYSATPVDIDKKDDAYTPATYESLMGIRMPDAVAVFSANGRTYLVTANEGDAREWGDEELGTDYLNEDERDFGEEGTTSPTGAITADNSSLTGKVVFFLAEDYDGLSQDKDYLFGGRSFTVLEVTDSGLSEIFTSGDDFEALTAQYLPDYYNCSNDNAVLDDRSGKKGPEPESVTLGTAGGRMYAFVALERTGGIMVYDVTDPASTAFINYINTRDFASTVQGSEVYEDGELDKWVTGGDVAPEGLLFVDGADSPTGEALLLAACEVSGTVAVYQVGGEAAAMSFADVPADSWYADAVQYVSENGLMSGTDTGVFSPNESATRGMIAAILWRLEGSPVVNYLMNYTDVPQDSWNAEAIRWASSEGIVNGYGDGTFGPNDAVTREQLAQMLYRYAGYKGMDTTQGGMAIREFTDFNRISDGALQSMNWAVNAGLIGGTDENMLEPQGTATRAETAVILLRLSQVMAQ